MDCTDREQLERWCADIPGDSLAERRMELFGRLAASREGDLKRHLEACGHCREALESERMIAAFQGEGKIAVARCPASEQLLDYLQRAPHLSPWQRLEIRMHLEKCPLCRDEAEWGARVASVGTEKKDSLMAWMAWPKWRFAAVAAAAAVAVILAYLTLSGSRNYARYARIPDVPYELIVNEFAANHPEDAPRFQNAAHMVLLADYDRGETALRQLESRYREDLSVAFLLSHIAVKREKWEDALLLCQRAERKSLDGYRCWYLANVALKAGKMEVAWKEIRHSQNHSPFTESARDLKRLLLAREEGLRETKSRIP